MAVGIRQAHGARPGPGLGAVLRLAVAATVRGQPDHTIATASTRKSSARTTGERPQAWVSTAHKCSMDSVSSRWHAGTLVLGTGSSLPSSVSAISCTTCHSGLWRSSASSITSHTACSAGSLHRRTDALPMASSACSIQAGSSNALNSAIYPTGRKGLPHLVQGGLQQAQSKKGTWLTCSLFRPSQPRPA